MRPKRPLRPLRLLRSLRPLVFLMPGKSFSMLSAVCFWFLEAKEAIEVIEPCDVIMSVEVIEATELFKTTQILRIIHLMARITLFWRFEIYLLFEWTPEILVEFNPPSELRLWRAGMLFLTKSKGHTCQIPTSQNPPTTFKPNLTCIFLSARARYIRSKPDGRPCRQKTPIFVTQCF